MVMPSEGRCPNVPTMSPREKQHQVNSGYGESLHQRRSNGPSRSRLVCALGRSLPRVIRSENRD
jgi:hypothetical protein